MKKTLLTTLMIFAGILTTFAQQNKVDSILQGMLNQEEPALPTNEVKNHINEDVYIYDVVSKIKVINDTLKILYIGDKYPNHQIAIIIKGKEPNQNINFKIGDKWHCGGKATIYIYKKKPAIIVTNSVQFGTRIQI